MLKSKRPFPAMPCMDQALTEAVLHNDISQVRKAVQAGAAVNGLDREGLGAIHQAIYEENFDIVRLLVRSGANVRLRDSEGWTPLHTVAQTGNCELACFLLKEKANTDAVDGDGLFPIDRAETSEMRALLYRAMKRAGHVQLANRYKAFQEQEHIYESTHGGGSGETDSISSSVSAHSYLASEDDEGHFSQSADEEFHVLIEETRSRDQKKAVSCLSSEDLVSSMPPSVERGRETGSDERLCPIEEAGGNCNDGDQLCDSKPTDCIDDGGEKKREMDAEKRLGDDVGFDRGEGLEKTGHFSGLATGKHGKSMRSIVDVRGTNEALERCGSQAKNDVEVTVAVAINEDCQHKDSTAIRQPDLGLIGNDGCVSTGREEASVESGTVLAAKDRSQLKKARAAFFTSSPVPRRKHGGLKSWTIEAEPCESSDESRGHSLTPDPDVVIRNTTSRDGKETPAELTRAVDANQEGGKNETADPLTTKAIIGQPVTDFGDWDSYSESDGEEDGDDVIFFSLDSSSASSTKTAVLRADAHRSSITSLFSPDAEEKSLPLKIGRTPSPLERPSRFPSIDETSEEKRARRLSPHSPLPPPLKVIKEVSVAEQIHSPGSPRPTSLFPKRCLRPTFSESAIHDVRRRPPLKSLLKSATLDSETTSPRRRSVCFAPEIRFQSAVLEGDLVEMRSMISSESVDLNSFTPHGYTPLHAAALEGKVDCIAVLIDSGSLVNLQDEDGWTALHAAASQGHPEAVRYLLDCGADPCVTNHRGEAAYNVVGEDNSVEITVCLMVAMGGRFQEFERYEYHSEEEGEEEEEEETLVEEDEDTEEDVLEDVLENNDDCAFEDNNALKGIVRNSEKEQYGEEVKVFLPDVPSNTKSVSFPPNILLQQAVLDEDLSEVDKLLENYDADELDINQAVSSGSSLLHESVNAENLELVRLIVEKGGANLFMADADGWTSLHNASAVGCVDVARYLIRQGAKVSVLNNKGQFPLDVADSPEMEVLLKNAMLGKGVL
eukprot:m.310673 g.310673  ORF g.310673 m.310673 type:complete len:1006 (+) comp53700_c0_seq1:60-3077(+)